VCGSVFISVSFNQAVELKAKIDEEKDEVNMRAKQAKVCLSYL